MSSYQETIRRRIIIILAILGILAAVFGYIASYSLTVGILTITTDKTTYRQGERIIFTIRNNGFSQLEFPDPGLGLRIMNLDTGEFVSTGRFYPQIIHSIPPLQSEITTWDQKEPLSDKLEYRLVKPGNYVASVRTAGGFEPTANAEVRFSIVPGAS